MAEMEQLLPACLEGTDPELCIKLFKSTKNFQGLRKRIKSSNQKWKESFLEQKGLEAVLDMLSELKEASMLDADENLECIYCIKTILNSPSGMKYCVINGDEFVRRYIEGQCFKASLSTCFYMQLLTPSKSMNDLHVVLATVQEYKDSASDQFRNINAYY